MNLSRLCFIMVTCLVLTGAGKTTSNYWKTKRIFNGNSESVIMNGNNLFVNMAKENGKIVKEVRELEEFTDIQLDISADVSVSRGSKFQCVITAEENILPLILTKCSDQKLKITAKDGYSTQIGIKIDIVVPVVKKVVLGGSGNIALTDVTKDQVEVVINGSGNITASGKVQNFIAKINGSGGVDADKLLSDAATVTVNGSGDVRVHVTDTLKATINGSGDVLFFGKVSDVKSSINGSGKVIKK